MTRTFGLILWIIEFSLRWQFLPRIMRSHCGSWYANFMWWSRLMHCCFLCSIHVTFIVLCCIVLALAIHSAYFIKRFSLLTAKMSNKLLGTWNWNFTGQWNAYHDSWSWSGDHEFTSPMGVSISFTSHPISSFTIIKPCPEIADTRKSTAHLRQIDLQAPPRANSWSASIHVTSSWACHCLHFTQWWLEPISRDHGGDLWSWCAVIGLSGHVHCSPASLTF